MPDGGPVCLGHKCRNKFADGCKWPNIHYPLQNTNMMILGIPRIFTLTCLVTSSLSYKKCFANQVEFCTRFAKVAIWICQSYYLYLKNGTCIFRPLPSQLLFRNILKILEILDFFEIFGMLWWRLLKVAIRGAITFQATGNPTVWAPLEHLQSFYRDIDIQSTDIIIACPHFYKVCKQCPFLIFGVSDWFNFHLLRTFFYKKS